MLFIALVTIIAFLSAQIFLNDMTDMLNNKQSITPLVSPQTFKSSKYIQPIPLSLNLSPQKVKLGDMLFHDPAISPEKLSCSSCHNLKKGGADGLKTSKNSQGGFDEMNTQSVFNCGFNPKFFWNGRASTLQQQLEDVIHNPKHLNSNWNWIVTNFSNNATYQKSSKIIYGKLLNKSIIKDLIITYERSLYTPNSRFDQFLRGNQLAISQDEKNRL